MQRLALKSTRSSLEPLRSSGGLQVQFAAIAAAANDSSQVSASARQTPLYEVVRQDDNANAFIIARDVSLTAAQAMVQEYQAKGHKQVYWYRAASSSSSRNGSLSASNQK